MNIMDPDDKHDVEQADQIIAAAPLAGYGTHLRKSRDELVADNEKLRACCGQMRRVIEVIYKYRAADWPKYGVTSPALEQLLRSNCGLATLEKERDNWKETAEQENRNRDYYRGLVVECGETFGIEAKTQDDGGLVEDVLCAKVPELVKDLHTLLFEKNKTANVFMEQVRKLQSAVAQLEKERDELRAQLESQQVCSHCGEPNPCACEPPQQGKVW